MSKENVILSRYTEYDRYDVPERDISINSIRRLMKMLFNPVEPTVISYEYTNSAYRYGKTADRRRYSLLN